MSRDDDRAGRDPAAAAGPETTATDTADGNGSGGKGPSDGPRKRRGRITRRGFLIGTGVVGAAVIVGWRFGLPAGRLQIARVIDGGAGPGGPEGPPDAWFEVAPGEPIRLYLIKVEMGQGVHTALAQVAAEELDLPLDRLEVRSAPSSRGVTDRMGTTGSFTISSSYRPMREAAAVMREMLRRAAASRWDAPLDEIVASEGRVLRRGRPDEAVAYEELAEDLAGVEPPDDVPTLKPRSEFREIGRVRPRVDLETKLDGVGGFGLDARLPDMRYGATAKPPVIGARLRSASTGTALDVDGVTDVVIEDGFAGVVATRRSAARRGVAALDLDWEMPDELVTQEEVETATTVRGDGVTVQREGRPGRAFGGRVDLTAEYRSGMAAHAHFEPQSALLDVRPDGTRAWMATQTPDAMRDAIAEALGVPADEVDLIPTWLGGAFGRRLTADVATAAARLSRATGTPVHVSWTREEEFLNGFVRPPVHNVLEARIDDGRITAMRHRQASGDVAFAFLPGIAAKVLGADFGSWRGATLPYGGIGAREAIAERVRLRVPTGWWRGLGLLPNVFASESFMDEIALEVGADPVAFRLAHLTDEPQDRRLAAVIRAAAEAADWERARPEGTGLGVAASVDAGTCVAMVAEVRLGDGLPIVRRAWVAVDPGLIVSPDGVRQQVEGCVAWGVGSLFFEEIRIEDGAFSAENFDRYLVARASDVPDVETILIEGDDEPHGVGEPPLGPVAAAIANAVVAAGGPRVRTMPGRFG